MYRILLVNDEEDLVDICRLLLEEAGYQVDTLTDGRRALDVARSNRPDLIVLDWIIKDSTGEDVLRQLRGDSEMAAVPVLMVSAVHNGEMTARTYGANAFLRKPFSAEALVGAIQALLSTPAHQHSSAP
jgi:DNA-binding response OmpR family regulator